MGVPYEKASAQLTEAAEKLFAADPRVRSVGIGQHQDAFGYTAVRNSAMILPASASVEVTPSIADIPVSFLESFANPHRLVQVPLAAPASFVPEQGRFRPLACGLQIQNFDQDLRSGIIQQGKIIIGTLGCFVQLADGSPAIPSNNHVVAGEEAGQRNKDRIFQPGSGTDDPDQLAAILTDFVDIVPSPVGATPQTGDAIFNDVDAGAAKVVDGVAFGQRYLPFHSVPAPNSVASAKVGDRVFKIGRTTGLTRGSVVSVNNITGPVPYDPGPCWFRRTIVIEGLNGTMFSDHGDSGSAIVRENGEVIGLLFAGNGQQTFACPFDRVLQSLNCTLL